MSAALFDAVGNLAILVGLVLLAWAAQVIAERSGVTR